VRVLAVRRDNLIEEPSQVAQRTAFIFYGRQSTGGGWAENSC
jgi:hypothetical protein